MSVVQRLACCRWEMRLHHWQAVLPPEGFSRWTVCWLLSGALLQRQVTQSCGGSWAEGMDRRPMLECVFPVVLPQSLLLWT